MHLISCIIGSRDFFLELDSLIMRLFRENKETSLQCCKTTEHTNVCPLPSLVERFTRCRVRTFQTVAGFLCLDFVTFMLCELLFIAGTGDRRLKRTSRLHANVTDIRRMRGNRFEPVPPVGVDVKSGL